MIPREWIIDCVECTENESTSTYRRVPDVLDANPVYMPGGLYTGTSLIRRQSSTESKQVRYQDTNHSKADMVIRTTPALKK